MNSPAKTGLILAFCTSLCVHGAAYASLSAEARTPPRVNEVSELNFELPPLRTPVPTPEPEPAPPSQLPAAREPSPVARTPPASPPARSTPAPTPTPATAAPALDLSGVTLSNDSGSGFAMPLGDGSALRAAIGLGRGRPGTLAAPSAAPTAAKPPALVDASDLSEHPRPPPLAALLRANYPEEARQRGLRGSASLRARIDADGVIRSARLLSESSGGFGSACRRTVLGSRWSAPRDKNGGAVATEIVYTCRFEVDP